MQVKEVFDLRYIPHIPNAPNYIVGLMDVRGRGIPIIDMRAKFNLPRTEAIKSHLGDRSRSFCGS
jgi:purine-binding chemotaxis protein CheW